MTMAWQHANYLPPTPVAELLRTRQIFFRIPQKITGQTVKAHRQTKLQSGKKLHSRSNTAGPAFQQVSAAGF